MRSLIGWLRRAVGRRGGAPDVSPPTPPAGAGDAAPAQAVAPPSPPRETRAADAQALTRRIDEIEREMRLAPPVASAPAPGAARRAQAPAPPPEAGAATEPGPTLLLGDTRAALSFEVEASEVPPPVEEAAMLYAGGQTETALAVLESVLEDGSLGAWRRHAWRMALDALQYLGRWADFDATALAFAARFETSPPAWRDDAVAGTVPAVRPSAAAARIELPPTLDEAVAPRLETVGASGRPVNLDARAVRVVDATGARALLAALTRLERGTAAFSVQAADRLLDAARRAVGTGRRDEDDACWQLLLAAHRLLDARQDFEDASIDFCITYEVSPPPWVPMPAHGRPAQELPATAPAAGEALPVRVAGDLLVLEGRIDDDAGPLTAALRALAAERRHVVIDCDRLQRIDFVAAGRLYNELAAMRATGHSFELRGPNHAVTALLAVLGVPEVATVTPRRA